MYFNKRDISYFFPVGYMFLVKKDEEAMWILNHLRENLTCTKFAHWENALACGYNSH